MNIRKIHILRLLATLLLCGTVASCSQDELSTDHGNALPAGEYPLLFTASIGEMTSRADQTDPWGDGDVIAVQIADYVGLGKYALNVDGSVKESDQPLSWPYEKGYVKAWYPYVSAGKTIEVDISDQSEGIHDFDFLYAITDKEEYFRNTVNLRFKHQMAKVSCRLTNGDGVTAKDLKTARVSYYGKTSVAYMEGKVTGSGAGWVSADTSNTALLVPQVVPAIDFIKVDITLTLNGNPIVKTLTFATNGFELEAGYHYVYNITVRKDRLEVESVTAKWNDKEDSGPAKIDTFKVYMPKDLPEESKNELIFSNSVKNGKEYKNGDDEYLVVEGNDFTISYSAQAETLMSFSIIEGSQIDKSDDIVDNPTVEKADDQNYDVVFHLRSKEVSLKWDYLILNPAVGNYYYSDGTWSKFFHEHKTCIGIVMATGAGSNDSGNDWLGTGDAIRGYVWALNEEVGVWYSESEIPNFINNNDFKGVNSNWDGCARTKFLLDVLTNGESAVKTCYNWETIHPEAKAPDTSSGWYLPTVGMVNAFFNNAFPSKNTAFFNAINDKLMLNNGGGSILYKYYWTTGLAAKNRAYYVIRSGLNSSPSYNYRAISYEYYIRPVLTFSNPKRKTEIQKNE